MNLRCGGSYQEDLLLERPLPPEKICNIRFVQTVFLWHKFVVSRLECVSLLINIGINIELKLFCINFPC